MQTKRKTLLLDIIVWQFKCCTDKENNRNRNVILPNDSFRHSLWTQNEREIQFRQFETEKNDEISCVCQQKNIHSRQLSAVLIPSCELKNPQQIHSAYQYLPAPNIIRHVHRQWYEFEYFLWKTKFNEWKLHWPRDHAVNWIEAQWIGIWGYQWWASCMFLWCMRERGR